MMPTSKQNISFLLSLLALVSFSVGCGSAPMPYHGFADNNALDKADGYVIAESVGGKLDPKSLSQEDQRYAHDGIAYDRMEEGFYQWGGKVFELGYRDEYYVRELEPRAFKRDLLDIYDKAIQAGFENAEDQAKKKGH